MRTGAGLLEKGLNRLPREADDGGTEDYLNVPPIDITTALLRGSKNGG